VNDCAPTPEELDDLCAQIAGTGYASEAVEIVEEWTRRKWGVESAFTTKWREERTAEQDAQTPFVHPSPFEIRP
jgi:hypothetical protein